MEPSEALERDQEEDQSQGQEPGPEEDQALEQPHPGQASHGRVLPPWEEAREQVQQGPLRKEPWPE